MKNIFVDSYNIISPLGNTALENYNSVAAGVSGVKPHKNESIQPHGVYAALIDDSVLNFDGPTNFSRFEKLIYCSIKDALNNSEVDASSNKTLFIFSTTKGNISLLDNSQNEDDVSLHNSALKISRHFSNLNHPVIISNACISGVTALIYAGRVIEQGVYDNIIITGADCINKFIYSGFMSFMALSPGACKPFSKNRDGINLGEAGATIILSTQSNKNNPNQIKLGKGAITNDANHISGPSRTGEELCVAIKKAVQLSDIKVEDIGFISAHGTGTSFNDQMEANAIQQAGMESIPVNSLKGYFGHSLGAAGLVESIISILSLEKGEVIPTLGFEEPVLEPKVNVTTNIIKNNSIKHFLKTASGFGGCNAAIVFSK